MERHKKINTLQKTTYEKIKIIHNDLIVHIQKGVGKSETYLLPPLFIN